MLRFQEFAQDVAAPSVHLERNIEGTQLNTRHPRPPHALYGPAPETDWNADWRCAELQTIWPVKPSGKGRAGGGAKRPDFWRYIIKMNVKTSFFDVVCEVKKSHKPFLQELLF